jgi:N utilization substance protein A
MESASRKAFGQDEEVSVKIDRVTGDIQASCAGQQIDMKDLGRIAAQTAKQVMIQKIREAERGSIYEEFAERKGQLITGTVLRYEAGGLVINLGRTEGFLPRSEQIPGETHHPGERIRTLITEVREAPHQVKIILSRSHPDLIRRLFELEVPEVAERVIEIRALAREAGYRTKVAVTSIDSRVDAVGACVGVRGSRIKTIVDELGGEKIDIVRWNESSQILIANALRPAEISEMALCFELGRVTVVVNEDQLSLAIGKRGQNVRLAARLTGWDIDILTPEEYNKGLDDMEKALSVVEGVEPVLINKIVAMGMITLMDIEEVGAEPLIKELEIEQELAERIIEKARVEAKRIVAEMEAAKAKAAEERARQEAEGLAEGEEATQDADSESNTESAAAEEVEPAAEQETAVDLQDDAAASEQVEALPPDLAEASAADEPDRSGDVAEPTRDAAEEEAT